ncbi:TPA: ead/Ea22-like family protein, partial [Pseudomonas aeruginosa]|nr:ead/Ea22-like family protein [Pseudomonas aeruginosa]HDY6153310.1 ead/Ea22-like family protein [Pseudomonas aeruginosa]
MTDLTKLKELAERATPGPWSAAWEEGDDTAWPNLFPVIQAGNGEVVIGNEGFYTDLEQDKANATFCAAANPQAILGLIAEVERLRSRLEIDERIPHDGIACRDETIKGLDEIDRLKAENCAHKDTQKHCEWLAQDLKECASVLPGTYYMDPPDGGNVSIPEQIRRMAKDAARYRWLRERDLETIRQGGVFAGMTPENIVLNLEHLDAAIDAALEGA